MKIRQDFVTNSSSTSFIISLRAKWDEPNFLRAIGIEGESSMNLVFQQLFEAIESSKSDIRKAMKDYDPKNESVSAFLRDRRFEEETIEIVEKLLADDRLVFYGELDSDGSSAAEVFFCMESFLVCDDDIYFNGRIGGW